MSTLIRQFDWAKTPIGELDQWPVSLRTVVRMTLTSRFPMLIFWGPALITFYNDAFRPSLGNEGKHPSSLGQPGHISWSETWPVIGPMIDTIMAGGESVWFEDQKLPIYREGHMDYAYWTYCFSALTDDEGDINGVLVTCTETTKTVESIEQLQESQRFADSLFYHSPIANVVFMGPDMTVHMANEAMLSIWGRDRSVVGLPFLDALPELGSTHKMQRLRTVWQTGEPFYQTEERFDLIRYGQPYTGYYNYVYEALRSATGEINGVSCSVYEVTEQVLTRKAIAASEARLRSLVESAPFPIALYVGERMHIELANRSIMDVWGKGYDVIGKSYQDILPELASQPIFAQVEGVRQTGVAFHARHQQVDIVIDGRLQPFYFNYSFTPVLDENGQVYGVMNTAAEVTDLVLAQQALAESEARYRELAQDLEHQIENRTYELASANEELAASNEEYAAINEELEGANRLLSRSNDNLQQFAYVASHDLQEPLRKIQQFGNLLQLRQTKQALDSESVAYIERMQSAASRMSTLIRDILTYSRIDTHQEANHPVPLTEVMAEVRTNLELSINETGAVLLVDELPTVSGDFAQLSQLFQNLLSNALKFRKADTTPVLQVQTALVPADQLPVGVHPARSTRAYYRIDVKDNGIGFDPKYVDRIFQVFQRLHGKGEYEGTGIGLAICQRVAANHGGTITAHSQPGEGLRSAFTCQRRPEPARCRASESGLDWAGPHRPF
ncbi:PAS domain-containing sensor histidine kinase [Spirosoma rhododendri]|uniref:PAS domain-containing sensor histidine kinase n=1 Tax=Spirosoma rhododendri TaxID=2728024 RepID=UPI0020C40354|nr:PAS domain-containing protein [Spirosoma rhododendri]